MSYTFYPDTTEQQLSLEILEDSIPEGLEIFRLSITEPIKIVGESTLNPAVSGPPLDILVYDNDCRLYILMIS